MAQTPAERQAKRNECHKRLHDERIRWGLCIRCGKQLTDEKTLQCKACLAMQAERREKDRDKILEIQRRRAAEHRAKGLCLYCNSPAVTKTRCEYHWKYYLMLDRDKRNKKTAEQEAQECES